MMLARLARMDPTLLHPLEHGSQEAQQDMLQLKSRDSLVRARVDLYMEAEKWDMAAAVASHLVKVEPEESAWWISFAYATRRCESIEKAETILLRARELHHENAWIEFNLACYASVTGRFEEAKVRMRMRSIFIRRLDD